MRRLFWPAVGIALLLVAVGVIDLDYVIAPLIGLLIFRIGTASIASFRAGGAHIPEGPPRPVDIAEERVVYWCAGCGAELLLLVRGAQVPPRHCGERMTERREVPGTRPSTAVDGAVGN